MQYLDRDNVVIRMDARSAPACKISDGESITIRTYDCFKGKLVPEGSSLKDTGSEDINPATGPVYIEGAMPGDTLEVEILKISLDEMSVVAVESNFGCLGPDIQKALIKRMKVTEQAIYFSDQLQIVPQPMIGVIGTAPAEKAISTETPGEHGGNMDCTRIKEGALLYLPVFTEGALLAVGDLHACMGDGEVGGCGAEVSGEVTLKVTVLKSRQKSYPFVLCDEKIHIIASDITVEAAWRRAAKQAFDYLREETTLTGEEAAMLLSLTGDLAICQTVNPQKTVRMSIPLYCLHACGWRFGS